MKLIEGKVVAKSGMKVGIVASRFNAFIVQKLLDGAVDGLVRHGVVEENISAAWVPGAFEIPVVAQKMAASKKYDAVICVGAVIRGSTSHYDYVCAEVRLRRSQQGHRASQLQHRRSGLVRHFDHRQLGASHRPRRRQERQQGLRLRPQRD